MPKRPRLKSTAVIFSLFAATYLSLGIQAVNAQVAVGNGPDFNNPRALARDLNGDLIVADFGNGNIYRIDAVSGNRVVLSDSSTGAQGPRLSAPAGVVVLDDGRIFVTALNRGAVYEIDAVDGTRTLLAGEDGSILSPFGLAAGILNGKTTLVVADTGRPAGGEVVGPVLVDPYTGAVSLPPLKANNTILYNDPRSVAVIDGVVRGKERRRYKRRDKGKENDTKRRGERGRKDDRKPPKSGVIVVGNFGSGEVIAVRANNGRREIISSTSANPANQVGSGPSFNSISDIAIADDGDTVIVMDLGNDALLGVDVRSGDRTAISRSGLDPVGAGDDFSSPHGIEVLEDGFMVTDFGVPGLTQVAADGTRTFFSTTPLDGFTSIRAISLTAAGDILAADFGGGRIFSVDPVAGVRTLISGSKSDGTIVGSGANFAGPVAAVELPDGRIAVAQFQNTSVMYFVDPTTGDRTILQGPGRGTGVALASRGFILDPLDTSRLLATSFTLHAVVAVDIATGGRTVLSSADSANAMGSGPAFSQPLGIAVDPATGTIYVSDLSASGGAIFSVDASGNRALVSTTNADGIGGGVPFGGRPFGVSVINGAILAVATDVVQVDALTGNRTLISAGSDNLFSIRDLDSGHFVISNFGSVQGIEVVDKITGVRTTLSNASNP